MLYLNDCAGRSLNDLTQYPVMPWILSQYDGDAIDLADPTVYRDLSKPMGAQQPHQASEIEQRYLQLKEMASEPGAGMPPPFGGGLPPARRAPLVVC